MSEQMIERLTVALAEARASNGQGPAEVEASDLDALLGMAGKVAELIEAGNALAENLWFGDEASRKTAEQAIARWRAALAPYPERRSEQKENCPHDIPMNKRCDKCNIDDAVAELRP